MPETPSKLGSMIACKCPRCRTGNIFKYPTYNIPKFSKTNTSCPHCGLIFEHETGFFWGAMYISYGFSSGLMIVFGIIAINLSWSFTNILIAIIAIAFMVTPFFFRYARVLMLYWLSPGKNFDRKYL